MYNFNPRTPCGVRRRPWIVSVFSIKISIHAPHAGCDRVLGRMRKRCEPYFNPRTPCGVRLIRWTVEIRRKEFQSTHPMRGATTRGTEVERISRISIHAPHAGCDSKTRQNHHVPLHKTYIVYQIFISLALYLLMFFKQKIKIAQNSGAKSCVLL